MKKLLLLCLLLAGCAKKTTTEKWEMVIHARGGMVEQNRIVLEDVSQTVTLFTKGQPRRVTSISMGQLIDGWSRWFASSEPNATLVMRTADKRQQEQVVILAQPNILGENKLEFEVQAKKPLYVGQVEEVVLLIDTVNAECLDGQNTNLEDCPNLRPRENPGRAIYGNH